MKAIITSFLFILLILIQPACSLNTQEEEQQQKRTEAGDSSQLKTIRGRVTGVTDGDTLTILDEANTEHRVRLKGIDAPESKQDFGQAAKKNLSLLVFNKRVEVIYMKLDRYGRVLGIVRTGGEDINLQQIALGFAWHYKEYESEQTEDERRAYGAAEERARKERRGLWQQPNPVKPSTFRRSK